MTPTDVVLREEFTDDVWKYFCDSRSVVFVVECQQSNAAHTTVICELSHARHCVGGPSCTVCLVDPKCYPVMAPPAVQNTGAFDMK